MSGRNHLRMGPDDPEKRLADLENQLAEQKRIAVCSGFRRDPTPIPGLAQFFSQLHSGGH